MLIICLYFFKLGPMCIQWDMVQPTTPNGRERQRRIKSRLREDMNHTLSYTRVYRDTTSALLVVVITKWITSCCWLHKGQTLAKLTYRHAVCQTIKMTSYVTKGRKLHYVMMYLIWPYQKTETFVYLIVAGSAHLQCMT